MNSSSSPGDLVVDLHEFPIQNLFVMIAAFEKDLALSAGSFTVETLLCCDGSAFSESSFFKPSRYCAAV